MRYYQKYQNWVINENNLNNIQVANNNIAIAKSSETTQEIGSRIGNALGRLNRIDTSTLTDEEKPKFTIAFDEIMKLVQNGDAQALLNKGKRQKRFDKLGAISNDLKGDVEQQNKEDITDEIVNKESDSSEKTTEPKTAAEQPAGKEGEKNEIDTIKNSIKANIQTGKQITNSSKLPILSQKLSGKATPDKVKFVQAFLKSKGYLGQTSEATLLDAADKDIDGNYGPATTAAVQKYQQEKGLGADGVVGTDTWNAMLKDVGNTTANVTAVQFDKYRPTPQKIEKKGVEPKPTTPKAVDFPKPDEDNVEDKIKPEDNPNKKEEPTTTQQEKPKEESEETKNAIQKTEVWKKKKNKPLKNAFQK